MFNYFQKLIHFLIALLLLIVVFESYSNHLSESQNMMFRQPKDISSNIKNNVKNLPTTNSYETSLPLLISALLKDEKIYEDNLRKIKIQLESGENSFNAWIWGRVLLAATYYKKDNDTIYPTLNKLSGFLSAKKTEKTNLAFLTWGFAYHASLNYKTYRESFNGMQTGAKELTALYKNNPIHDNLSNALWAWVMNLSAAANNDDRKFYNECKDAIRKILKKETVVESLKAGLLRKKSSNDYPAWAFGIVMGAAAIMGDIELYEEADIALTASLKNANPKSAEYMLAVLVKQLALDQLTQQPDIIIKSSLR